MVDMIDIIKATKYKKWKDGFFLKDESVNVASLMFYFFSKLM